MPGKINGKVSYLDIFWQNLLILREKNELQTFRMSIQIAYIFIKILDANNGNWLWLGKAVNTLL